MVLSQEQIDSFHLKGFLNCGKLLEDDEIEILREEYDKEMAIGDYGKLTGSADPDSLIVKQIMQMCERNMVFRKFIYNEKILDVIQDLMGPNIQLFHDQALYKSANDGGATLWHQDNSYWKCHPASLISCWMTLDDVVEDQGAMQYVPGSHLTPVRHHRSGGVLQDTILTDEQKASIEVVEVPAGHCILHHCQTLHFTKPNITENQRRAFAIHFMTPGTIQDENILSVSYKQPMLRMKH